MIRIKGFFPVVFLFSALLLSSGCATMFSREYDDLTIESNPPGAEVYLGAEHIGTTPFTKRFDRDTFESPQITLRKEGYKPQTVTLQRTLEKTALLNFGFFLTTCGVTSWAIDAASGSMIRYAPDSYLVDLHRLGDEGSASWRRHHLALAFVLTNHPNLMTDISRGRGEYLEAYYHLNFAPVSTASYPAFLQAIRKESAELLECTNGLELERALKCLLAQPAPATALSTNWQAEGAPRVVLYSERGAPYTATNRCTRTLQQRHR